MNSSEQQRKKLSVPISRGGVPTGGTHKSDDAAHTVAQLVSDVFMQPPERHADWCASVASVIQGHLGADAYVVGLQVFKPAQFDADTSWATDELSQRCGLNETLAAPIAINASHPALKKSAPRSVRGGVLSASSGRFLRLATPVTQFEHVPTLVLQIESHRDARLEQARELVLATCLPAFSSAYYKAVGHIAAHRERLVGKLKPVQRVLVQALVEGASERAIAEQFGRSPHTVHDHIKGIYAAWGVRSRLQVRDIWFDRPLARGE